MHACIHLRARGRYTQEKIKRWEQDLKKVTKTEIIFIDFVDSMIM